MAGLINKLSVIPDLFGEIITQSDFVDLCKIQFVNKLFHKYCRYRLIELFKINIYCHIIANYYYDIDKFVADYNSSIMRDSRLLKYRNVVDVRYLRKCNNAAFLSDIKVIINCYIYLINKMPGKTDHKIALILTKDNLM